MFLFRERSLQALRQSVVREDNSVFTERQVEQSIPSCSREPSSPSATAAGSASGTFRKPRRRLKQRFRTQDSDDET